MNQQKKIKELLDLREQYLQGKVDVAFWRVRRYELAREIGKPLEEIL